jgi:hypothetical protein
MQIGEREDYDHEITEYKSKFDWKTHMAAVESDGELDKESTSYSAAIVGF